MLTIHPVPGKAKSRMICEAFRQGAPGHAGGHVFFGVTEGNLDAWKRVVRDKLDFWYIDNSYFDAVRGAQFRVTKNRVQHSGVGLSDCRRFDALGTRIEPVREPRLRGRVLCVQQSDLFMRLVAGDKHWLVKRMTALLGRDGWADIRMRPWNSDKAKRGLTLQEDLNLADLVVTHTSAVAVTAVLQGLPVETSDACAAYQFGPTMMHPDRRQWAGVLADNQFTLDEMKDGTAWAMLAKN